MGKCLLAIFGLVIAIFVLVIARWFFAQPNEDFILTRSKDDADETISSPLTSDWLRIELGVNLPPNAVLRMDMLTGQVEARLATRLQEPKLQLINSADASAKNMKMAITVLKSFQKGYKTGESKRRPKAHTSERELEKQIKRYKHCIGKNCIAVKVSVLEHIEVMVHEFVLANQFAKRGGIHALYTDLHSKDRDIQKGVLLVFAAAIQLNPYVKSVFREFELMPDLFSIIKSTTSAENKAYAIYVLAAFLHNSPETQLVFVETYGVAHITDVFYTDLIENNKVKVKALNLFHSLLEEKNSAKEYSTRSEEDIKNLVLYDRIPLEQALKKNNFCVHLAILLKKEMNAAVIETLIQTMKFMTGPCKDIFIPVIGELRKLAAIYHEAAVIELKAEMLNPSFSEATMSELYYNNVYNTINSVISDVTYQGMKYDSRDEL